MSAKNDQTRYFPTATQWGTYSVEVEGGRIKALHDYKEDPAPSIIGGGLVDAVDDKVRVRRPMVRKSFLEKGLQSNTVTILFSQVLMGGPVLEDFITLRAKLIAL